MTTTNNPTIRVDDDNLVRVATSNSLDPIDEHAVLEPLDPNEPPHEQDWTLTTPEHASWAARERRRSSVWSKIDADMEKLATSPVAKKFMRSGSGGSTGAPQDRRGSILSLWQPGKDSQGKDVLYHHDHQSGSESEEEVVPRQEAERRGSVGSEKEIGGPYEKREDRRGSILSLWGRGKDEFGNHVLHHHDDEEWKV